MCAGRDHGRRQRQPQPAGRIPGRVPVERPRPAVVVLSCADQLQGARAGCVAGVDADRTSQVGDGGKHWTPFETSCESRFSISAVSRRVNTIAEPRTDNLRYSSSFSRPPRRYYTVPDQFAPRIFSACFNTGAAQRRVVDVAQPPRPSGKATTCRVELPGLEVILANDSRGFTAFTRCAVMYPRYYHPRDAAL